MRSKIKTILYEFFNKDDIEYLAMDALIEDQNFMYSNHMVEGLPGFDKKKWDAFEKKLDELERRSDKYRYGKTPENEARFVRAIKKNDINYENIERDKLLTIEERRAIMSLLGFR